MENRNGMLYPMMIIAAISVILFSVVGIVTMTGHIPSALSTEAANAQAKSKADVAGRAQSDRTYVASNCGNCGVVESVRIVEARGQASGVGAVAGGVTGAILGNQVGAGNGRTATTILGAAGGAYLGNEIEKNSKKSQVYRITVRMEDGTSRTVTQRSASVSVGERVKVVDGTVVPRG